MKVYRKVSQTKYIKEGLKGLLTIHDNGAFAVSMDHQGLFNGLKYKDIGSYYCIEKPTTKEREIIIDRLFDF